MRDDNLKTGGTSGKFFYLTDDNNFLVETISENELKSLKNIILKICDHQKYN